VSNLLPVTYNQKSYIAIADANPPLFLTKLLA